MCVPSMIRILHDDMKWLLSNFSVVWLLCFRVLCLALLAKRVSASVVFISDFCSYFSALLHFTVWITVGWMWWILRWLCFRYWIDEREKDLPNEHGRIDVCEHKAFLRFWFDLFFLHLISCTFFMTLILVPEWSCFYIFECTYPTYLTTLSHLILTYSLAPWGYFTSFSSYREIDSGFFWAFILQMTCSCIYIYIYIYDITTGIYQTPVLGRGLSIDFSTYMSCKSLIPRYPLHGYTDVEETRSSLGIRKNTYT